MEMQNVWQHFIINRGIYYAAANLHQQLSPGDKDFKLKELIYICFTNFIFDPDDTDTFIKTIKFNIQENNKVFYNKLTFKYIELPKFKKAEQELLPGR